MNIEAYGRNALMGYLKHRLQMAGATQRMTAGLTTLIEHTADNLRMLNMMASVLLDPAAQ